MTSTMVFEVVCLYYDIQFCCTDEHSNADGLSRLPLKLVGPVGHVSEAAVFNLQQLDSLPLTATKLAMATHTDKVLSKVYRYTIKGWPREVEPSLRPFAAWKDQLAVEGGCVLWGIRVVIPEEWREKLLMKLHRDHPGKSAR